jgi:hypothetical protein
LIVRKLSLGPYAQRHWGINERDRLGLQALLRLATEAAMERLE